MTNDQSSAFVLTCVHVNETGTHGLEGPNPMTTGLCTYLLFVCDVCVCLFVVMCLLLLVCLLCVLFVVCVFGVF